MSELKCRVYWRLMLLLQLFVAVSCDTCIPCPTSGTESWDSQLMVCNIRSRDATVMWSRDTSTSSAAYIVVLDRDIGSATHSEPISGDEEVFTYNITNLSPETNYSVQVCQTALDPCGSCTVNFVTPAAREPSGPPINVMLLASGPSTLTVSWSAPLINPEFVEEYFIKCAIQNDPSNSRTISRLDFVRSAPFHNLIPDTIYDCEVSAGSIYGNSTPARASATTHPRETDPGLLFIVTQGTIRYVHITERTLADVFSNFENIQFLLDVDDAHISGVDYHFHGEEIYLTLSNGTIQRYKISISETNTGELNLTLLEPPMTVYTTDGENTVGSITIDWLNNIIYWIEVEGSDTKIYRMTRGSSNPAMCAITLESHSVNKIVVDPVHGYMYWNEQGNGLFRGPLDEFQSSECSPPSTKETIFSSSPVVDFVLEPEVFIYFTADQVVQFVGFDKENNGTIEGSEAMFLESFGDATVVIFNNITRLCNATTQTCPFSVASLYSDEVYPIIDDILVFRKSKQPLPVPPSHPTNVHVFTGTSTASITWNMPTFVESFFGTSAYDNWTYYVNYTTLEGSSDTYSSCTDDLNVTLHSLENDTFYQFNISANGLGGERPSPYLFVFRTKPAGIQSANLLVSTDAKVTKSDLDGTNSQPISTSEDVVASTKESNGVAYDIQNNLYFWIIKGGQSPLYRYNVTSQKSSTLGMPLDRPVSLAADWVQKRLFWVQDGINLAADRQLVSINMDGIEDTEDVFTEDAGITAIAVDSLNGKIFWISGKDIIMNFLNGLVQTTCVSLDSEPLALALDVERQHLYWMTFDTEENTVMLSQLNYNNTQCGTSPTTVKLHGIVLASSSRGVLTYGLGTLYLTTESVKNQSVYAIPADFASISGDLRLAFGVIPHDNIVRDIFVVSEILQPLPDGLGCYGIAAEKLSKPPSLNESESNTSVIVIEWGESPTCLISQPILYEVVYTLTPFDGTPMGPVKMFTTDTFIQLEDQTFFTEVKVNVTPHTVWLTSDVSLTEMSQFTSTPMEPVQVVNVRAYVYHPLLNKDNITALIVWDALNATEAGGIVNHYDVSIQDLQTNKIRMFQTSGNESYFIVRDFIETLSEGGFPFTNVLYYPLQSSRTYQVSANNSGGNGEASTPEMFSTHSVMPPQQLLVVTKSQSLLQGTGDPQSYMAVSPLAINTLSRLMYWYNSTTKSVMVQSLDGTEIAVFLESSPINISAMAFEWQGERLYMAGFNSLEDRYELWRVPVVYSEGIEHVYQMSEAVQSVSHLVVDSFRGGSAYWLEMVDDEKHLVYLSLNGSGMQHNCLSNITVSAITLDPLTGDLWVSDYSEGGILACSCTSTDECQEVVDASSSGNSIVSIGLDEDMVYWTNGSVINSINRTASSRMPFSSGIFEDGEVVSLHSLSPGQQPQLYIAESCRDGITCLAPFALARPAINENITTTNITIEVWWDTPPLEECCTSEVFSYPLVEYDFFLLAGSRNPLENDPFATHLKIDNLIPHFSYRVLFSTLNTYSIIPIPSAEYTFISVQTEPGVPGVISNLTAETFGVTCIEVSWSGPGELLRGPEEDKIYYITITGSGNSSDYSNNDSNSVIFSNATPGELYKIEVKVSNMVFNSSTEVIRNIESWPQAPPPVLVVDTLLNTSFSVTVTLEERHINIVSLYIEAMALDDGVNQNSSQKNVTSPGTVNFTLYGLSSFTEYSVYAVATYDETNCSRNTYDGEAIKIRTEAGVPDTPEIFINNDGIATWREVNSRSGESIDFYRVTATVDGMEVGGINVPPMSRDGNITQPLSDLSLQVDQRYNICVTAKNIIGHSSPGCNGSYIHMETEESSTSASILVYAGSGGAALAVFILIVSCVLFGLYVHKRRQQKASARLAYAYGPDLELNSVRAQRYYQTKTSSNQQYMWSREDFVATEEELAKLNQFPRQYLTLETFLGQGEFGEVFQGTAFDILGPETGPHPVAIKTFRKGASSEEKHKFLSEAALMGKFSHPNIVKILAVCVDNDPVFIIMELMPAGDLLKFLREARPESGPALLTQEEQLLIAVDIAQGCRYLEQQHFIHRDLAARNCLVSSKGADRVVKIGDFGLAKDLYSSDYYRVEGERKLPVRWMAPEALLQGKFTIESDVWAYGILLHEVMSFGNQPYPGQSNQDVLQFVTGGGRLPRPDNCPRRIYRIMMQCWRKYASERPHFEEICNTLKAILEDRRRESYCESDSEDETDTLSREGSKRFPSRSPSFKSGFQNLVRSGSKKLRNSLRRHSMHRREEQTTHTSVSSCENLIPSDNGDAFRESGLI